MPTVLYERDGRIAICRAAMRAVQQDEGNAAFATVDFVVHADAVDRAVAALEGGVAHWTGVSEPLPVAEPRFGRRTVLTFPLLPPPQKN